MTKQTSEPTREQTDDALQETASSPWNLVRYIVILGLLGFGLWYYFKTPAVYSAQQCQGKTMGTDYSVKVDRFLLGQGKGNEWTDVAEAIQNRLDELDRMMSTFQPDSEVSRFNTSDSTDWFPVSKDTADVVRLALEISNLTGGAFDVTVSPLVDLWGFGPRSSGGAAHVSETELTEQSTRLKEHVGYDKLEARLEPPGLKKSDPLLKIDLSAIAKGFAVDAVAQLLEQKKIVHYMVEVGGEVRCRGNKGAQGDWVIGIEKPLFAPPGTLPGLQRKLHLVDRSLATSGDYLNYRMIGDVRFSHILDPRTGVPTERIEAVEPTPRERLGSVSVIDPSCARADALATALFVLGEKEGSALAESSGLTVLFLFRTDDVEDPVREVASPAFRKWLE